MTGKTKKTGNCFICEDNLGKIAMKNHILRKHQTGEEDCYLLKAEGTYCKDYWLYFSVPLNETLESIDTFLRQIWCECCGHLSAFYIGRAEVNKNKKLLFFEEGEQLNYEYDFGSTTDILITIIGKISRARQK